MDPHRLTHLAQQLRSPALNLRKAALDELAQVPSELAVPILQELAFDRNFLYRRFAVMGLGNHPTDAALETLIQLLEQEEDSNVIAEVANALFEFGDRGLLLLSKLFTHHQNWLVRQSILGILVDANQPKILLDVIQLGLQDETVTTKETAILATGTLLNGPYHEQAILLLLAHAQSDQWRDRWRAATTLCIAQDPRATAMLAELRKDENHYVVAAALESGV